MALHLAVLCFIPLGENYACLIMFSRLLLGIVIQKHFPGRKDCDGVVLVFVFVQSAQERLPHVRLRAGGAGKAS